MMAKPFHVTAEERAHIIGLLKQRRIYRDIARLTGRSKDTIVTIAHESGLSCGSTHRISAAEENRIYKLLLKGHTYSEVGRRTNRSKDTVRKIALSRGLIKRRRCANPDCGRSFPVRNTSDETYCPDCHPTPDEIKRRAAAVRAKKDGG